MDRTLLTSGDMQAILAERIFPTKLFAVIRMGPEMKWRLVEEYGPDSFKVQEDGSLLIEWGFTDRENLFGWLLSFGANAELLEPQKLRREFAEVLERMTKRYRG